jgi:hypothetical protein
MSTVLQGRICDHCLHVVGTLDDGSRVGASSYESHVYFGDDVRLPCLLTDLGSERSEDSLDVSYKG